MAVIMSALNLSGSLLGARLKEKSLEVVWGDLTAAACHCWASSPAGGSTCVTAASSCSSSWAFAAVSSSPRLPPAGRGHSECPRTRRCTPGSLRRNPAAGRRLRRRCGGAGREGGLGGENEDEKGE